MIHKLKKKIKKKLQLFLGINELEGKLKIYINENNGRVSSFETKSLLHAQILNKHDNKIATLHDTLSNVVSVGADVNPNRYGNSSWTVVCIEGNYNVVKFIDLSSRDARDILHVLKSFESSRRVYDTPIGYFPKDCFIDFS